MASLVKTDKISKIAGGSQEFVLPGADGTANQHLKTDGSGNLGWASPPTGVALTGSTNTWIPTITGADALAGTANFTYDGNTLDVKNSGTASSINLYCETGNAHYTKIKSGPHASATSYTITLPNAPPSVSGQALTATTAGVGSWSGNSPSFQARKTSEQLTLTSNTYYKVGYETEDWDADSVYDHSTNFRFLVPAGEAGKYQLNAEVYCITGGVGYMRQSAMRFYLNGSASYYGSINDWRGTNSSTGIYNRSVKANAIMNLAVGDYVEVWVTIETQSGTWQMDNNRGIFSAFKLIGV